MRTCILEEARDGDALSVSDTFVEQPGVQLVAAFDPQPGREEALADQASLALPALR